VLHTGWHVAWGTGVAYGVILQAVEVMTAILMGMPALLKEGMSWREIKMRAMHATPVRLPERRTGGGGLPGLQKLKQPGEAGSRRGAGPMGSARGQTSESS